MILVLLEFFLKSIFISLTCSQVVTVEPGIYFHDFVFSRATPEQKRFLNGPVLERFKNFGGVRIEDCLRITKDGSENLSKDVPKEIDEIETLMKQ